jgi:AraC family transcriptional activator of tynA and feaB
VKTLFSITSVHPRDRFSCWHDVACKTLVDHDSSPECRQTFRAELQSGSLADIGLILFDNSPMTVSHDMRHVAHANADEVFVCRQVAGRLALEQDSREAVLEPGDFMLLDPRLPYTGKFFEGSKLLVLKVPRRPLEARIGKTRQMIAHSMRPLGAENRLTSAFIAMLPTYADSLGSVAAETVRDQVLDLVAVSLANAMEEKPRISSAKSLVLMKVRAAVEARLTDPALDATTVAAAAGVSIRYANAALAEESTSIGRLIQARRLARCRRALEDPAQTHRTVSEIAYGWGFSDMTHFGRKFRATYGLLPSEYRRFVSATCLTTPPC